MPDTSLKHTLETSDNLEYSIFLNTLSEETVRAISADQHEPVWMLEHRLRSLEIFHSLPLPSRGPSLEGLHFDEIVYYAKPKNADTYQTDWKEVDPTIKEKFTRLGIPEAERKYLAGAGGQMDSQNVYHKLKKKRQEK
jgi:Fe-S cluster assembly protein SufB